MASRTTPKAAPAKEKYNTPLRQAQRDLTRTCIKNAARTLFYERNFAATTMDEIAAEAGLRRSTLYLHYKDKADILADVIADYTPKAKENLATLPGPNPTLAQVQRWVRSVMRFQGEERAALSIILELRRYGTYNALLGRLTAELLEGLGTNNPPFALAAQESADPKLRAKGLLLLQEMTYGCGLYLENPKDARYKALLEVVAEDFHAFLSGPHATPE